MGNRVSRRARAVAIASVAALWLMIGCDSGDSRDGTWTFRFKTESGNICTDCEGGCVSVAEVDWPGEVSDGEFSYLHPSVSTDGVVKGRFDGSRVTGTAELGYNGCESKASHAVTFTAECVNDTQCKGTWEAPRDIIGASKNPGGFRGTVTLEKRPEGVGGGCESGYRACAYGCCPPGYNCCASGCCAG
jgi:hypothetical protein